MFRDIFSMSDGLQHLILKLLKYSIQQMNKEIPMINRICGYKQLKRAWDIHESKLKQLKGSIDVEAPKKYIFEKKKIYHNSIVTNRFKQIENQNLILLDKLTNIPRQNSQHTQSCDFSHIKKERHRYLETKAINQQNSHIIKRIKQKKPHYQLKSYLKERENTQKYINLISRFPYKNLPRTKTAIKFWMKNNPQKYLRPSKSIQNLTQRQQTLKEIHIQKQFNEKIYRISGEILSDKVVILIKNKFKSEQNYDIGLEINTGLNIINKHFKNDFRLMIDSIDYNREKKEFYIRLPGNILP